MLSLMKMLDNEHTGAYLKISSALGKSKRSSCWHMSSGAMYAGVPADSLIINTLYIYTIQPGSQGGAHSMHDAVEQAGPSSKPLQRATRASLATSRMHGGIQDLCEEHAWLVLQAQSAVFQPGSACCAHTVQDEVEQASLQQALAEGLEGDFGYQQDARWHPRFPWRA